MKRVLLAVLLMLTLSLSYAIPFNHNATLIPAKSALISGGFNGNLSSMTVEYTQGLKSSNLHGKLNFGGGAINIQGSMQHTLFEWNKIDMGFSYGIEFSVLTGSPWWEISPFAMWNISHKFTQQVDFYGGVLFAFDIGSTWGTMFTDIDFNMYYGTQIDLTEQLELYVELHTSIFSGANNAFIGVNYYLPNGFRKVK